jgi:hypothetical protein
MEGSGQVVGAPDAPEPWFEDAVERPEPLDRPPLRPRTATASRSGSTLQVHENARASISAKYRSSVSSLSCQISGRSRHEAPNRAIAPSSSAIPSKSSPTTRCPFRPTCWSMWSPTSCHGPSLSPRLMRTTPSGAMTRTSSASAVRQLATRWRTCRAYAPPKRPSPNGRCVASAITSGNGIRSPASSTILPSIGPDRSSPTRRTPAAESGSPRSPVPAPISRTGPRSPSSTLRSSVVAALASGEEPPRLVVHLGRAVERIEPGGVMCSPGGRMPATPARSDALASGREVRSARPPRLVPRAPPARASPALPATSTSIGSARCRR